MKKVLWTGILAGIAMLVVNVLLNFPINWLWPNLQEAYMNNEVFRPWDDPIMSLFFLYPIVLGLSLAFVWDQTKKLCKCPYWKKVFKFSCVY